MEILRRPSARGLVIGAVLAALVCAPSGAAAGPPVAATTEWQWPLDPPPQVVHAFDRPSLPWDAAHRGIDLAGSTGERVRSIGDGVVSFAGVVAGRGVVVVDHGRLRSTYEPVTALVRPGFVVESGQTIGLLQAVGSHCSPASCLHLGLRRGDEYLDPLDLLGSRPIRLKPIGLAAFSALVATVPTF